MDCSWALLTRYEVDSKLNGVVLNRCCIYRRPLVLMSGWVRRQCGVTLPTCCGVYGGLGGGVIPGRFCRFTQAFMLVDD